jgi:uncharacterized protein with ParB-like and HNH nuclease domain
MQLETGTTKIEEISDEKDDFYSNDDIFEFNSWGADLSFRELIQQYKDEDLLKPEIQRHYVWDKTEASRFIESILLGLPIPSIFLAKQDDEKLLIIDGYQRIKSVFDYVTGIFTGDGKVFKLTNSDKINKRWRGKSFTELTDIEQRRINKATIHSIIFAQKRPENKNTGMYQVFERINTSGKTLFPQEIRNCVYQGKLNSLIIELNKLPTWRILMGDDKIDSRMRDIELILRFFALLSLYKNQPKIQTISLKKYLNEFMGDEQNNTDEFINSARVIFTDLITCIFNLFGPTAFHNISTSPASRTQLNPTIFDSMMISFYLSNNQSIKQSDMIQRKQALLADDRYQLLIRVRTTDIKNIVDRIDTVSKYFFG